MSASDVCPWLSNSWQEVACMGIDLRTWQSLGSICRDL